MNMLLWPSGLVFTTRMDFHQSDKVCFRHVPGTPFADSQYSPSSDALTAVYPTVPVLSTRIRVALFLPPHPIPPTLRAPSSLLHP